MTVIESHRGPVDELRRYWRGEGPLWKLYWLYGVLLSTIGGAIMLGAVLERALPVPVLVLMLGLALVYTAYIQISIWRSAFNINTDPLGIDRDAWGWMARVLTVGWMLNAAGGSLMLLQFALGY
jgi:hypothetical protein